DLTEKLSFPPYRIICIASSGISAIGSLSLKSYFCPMISSCLKIQLLFCSPNGTNPPFLIDTLSSGIILFRFISLTTPSPLHFGQAPLGELKEKLLGSGTG